MLVIDVLSLCADVLSRGGEDVTQLEPPEYCLPPVSAPDSHTPATPLSVFYPPNLGKHFKVGVVSDFDILS